jgi:hypothetical protein
MGHSFWYIILLVALFVLRKPLVRIVVLLFLRKVLRCGLEDVGKQAIDKQPDQIHLTPEPGHCWLDNAAVNAVTAPLAPLGFREAGTFTIQEMPGVAVRFLVQPDQRVAACVCEHPRVGTWYDLVARYQDGRSITYTTARPTGLDPRPKTQTVRAEGTASDVLYQRLLSERPAGDLIEMTEASVVDRFQTAYAEDIAWRKNKGVSADEVAREIKLMPVEAGAPSDCCR